MRGWSRRLLRQWVPPALVQLYERHGARYGYFGDYKSWEAAERASTGYDSDVILGKVRDAILQVKEGKAVFERDSVLFDKVEYSWPLLVGLLWIASLSGSRLNLVDFGGSLGSSYFQNRKFLEHLSELHWNIVEQEKFVVCGRNFFADSVLTFYHSLDECMKEQNPGTILLGSVIQYLERPYDFLQEVIDRKFAFVILDRTPFLDTGEDRLTVQKVPPAIYRASYPAWFFSLEKFKRFMAANYELVAEFDTSDKANIAAATFKGFIFRRN